MNTPKYFSSLLGQLDGLNEQQLRRLLTEHLTKQKLGLYWEANAIERDAALNANVVLPRVVRELGHRPGEMGTEALHRNFVSLRLLRAGGVLNSVCEALETFPRRRASLATNDRRGGKVGARTSYAFGRAKRS